MHGVDEGRCTPAGEARAIISVVRGVVIRRVRVGAAENRRHAEAVVDRGHGVEIGPGGVRAPREQALTAVDGRVKKVIVCFRVHAADHWRRLAPCRHVCDGVVVHRSIVHAAIEEALAVWHVRKGRIRPRLGVGAPSEDRCARTITVSGERFKVGIIHLGAARHDTCAAVFGGIRVVVHSFADDAATFPCWLSVWCWRGFQLWVLRRRVHVASALCSGLFVFHGGQDAWLRP